MISPINPANPNQDPGKDFHDLLANLANHNKDLAFFKDKCLNILTHQVDWPVDDLIGYLEDLRPENILTPKNLQELHAQEIFQDSEHLMENIQSCWRLWMRQEVLRRADCYGLIRSLFRSMRCISGKFPANVSL